MFAEFGVLGGHAYGTGVGVALAHHDASQYNQCGGTETEVFRTQQGHVDNIPSGFQLSVHLQFHLSAESVQHQGLLRLARVLFRASILPYRILDAGDAPVPPSAPEMTIRSAFALATPAAMVPTPLSATSFTLIRACGFTFFRSKINWAKSSME